MTCLANPMLIVISNRFAIVAYMVHHTERPPIEPNRVYSREEVAEVLTISLSTVKRLIASGDLRVSQPRGMRRVLILGQHMLDLLAASEITPTLKVDPDKLPIRKRRTKLTQRAQQAAQLSQTTDADNSHA